MYLSYLNLLSVSNLQIFCQSNVQCFKSNHFPKHADLPLNCWTLNHGRFNRISVPSCFMFFLTDFNIIFAHKL